MQGRRAGVWHHSQHSIAYQEWSLVAAYHSSTRQRRMGTPAGHPGPPPGYPGAPREYQRCTDRQAQISRPSGQPLDEPPGYARVHPSDGTQRRRI
jgi:hypothetical protein